MTTLDPTGIRKRYVVMVRHDDKTPTSMMRTDDLAEAEKVRDFWPAAFVFVFDTERSRYVEREEEL